MKMIGTNFWQGTVAKKWQQLLVIGAAVTVLGACGPGLDSQAPYAIGGTVTGLIGTVVLQNNGGDNLSLTGNGSFKFSKELLSDAAYAVTVLTQPGGQFCTVSSGSGTATTEVTTVSVQCAVPWTKQLGAVQANTFGSSVATDSSGNIYVAGDTSGSLDGNQRTGASDFFFTKYGTGGVKQYTKQLGVAGQYTDGLSVATHTDLNGDVSVYVAGQTTGVFANNTALSAGTTDLFVSKYDGFGDLKFTRQLGEPGKVTQGFSVATDTSGNFYVAGQTTGVLEGAPRVVTTDFFVAKYDSIGAWQYTRQLGVTGANTYGRSIVTRTDASGNVSVYVAGQTTGALPGDTLKGATDFFIAKYDGGGNPVYSRQLGVAGANTFGRSVAIDAIGNVFVAGQTTGALPSNTAVNNTRTGAADFFIAKYDKDLNLRYTRQLGFAGATTDGLSVATDASGNVFVAGQTTGVLYGTSRTGTTDFFVTKYDNDLNLIYTRQLGVADKDTIGRSVATDASGNVYVVGDTSGGLDGNTLTGATDFFLTKYNSSGVKQ
jgi:hypothetical protein